MRSAPDVAAGCSRSLNPETCRALRAAVDAVRVEPEVREYMAAIVRATREDTALTLGGSPRASVALFRVARAAALLAGRDFATPDDVKAHAPAVLRHRVLVAPELEVEGRTSDDVIDGAAHARARAAMIPTRRFAALVALTAPVWLLFGADHVAARCGIRSASSARGGRCPQPARPRALHVQRLLPEAVGLGDRAQAEYQIQSPWPLRLPVEVHDALLPALERTKPPSLAAPWLIGAPAGARRAALLHV